MNTFEYQDVATAPRNMAGLIDAVPCAESLETLSQCVLKNWDADAWRDLFLGAAYATIRFQEQPLTLLLADSPLGRMDRTELGVLSRRLQAEAEVCCGADLAMAFRKPALAMRAALVLQRLAPRLKIRTALFTATCTVAGFQLQGAPHQLVIGPEVQQAEEALAGTPPGTIVISAETYPHVADLLAHNVRDAVVATELEDDAVARALVTLTPPRNAFSSTFAGLGRT